MKKEEARRKAQELGLEVEEDTVSALDRFDYLGLIPRVRKWRKDALVAFKGLDPTFKDSRTAESRFGSGIALYFWFYRFILQVTVLLVVVWGSFLVVHAVDLAGSGRALMPPVEFPFLPPALLYSSISAGLMGGYGAASLSSVAVLVVCVGGKFAYEVIAKNASDVQSMGQDAKRYAKLAFTAWDWGTDDLAAAEDLKESVASNFANLKFEDETEDRIRARTQGEWQVLTQP